MSDGESKGPGWDDLTKAAAAVAAITATISALAVSGILGRVERNHEHPFLIAVAFAALAAAFWPSVGWTRGRWRFALGGAVAVLFGAAVFLGAVSVVKAQQESQRPRITATVNDAGIVTARIEADGLHNRDHLRVIVEGVRQDLFQRRRLAPNDGRSEALYESSIGPDGDGAVDTTITVSVPTADLGRRFAVAGVRAWVIPSLPASCPEFAVSGPNKPRKDRPECSAGGTPSCITRIDYQMGCVWIALPGRPSPPRLAAKWARGRPAPSLVLTLRAERMPGVRFAVLGYRGHAAFVIARGRVPADGRGMISEELTLPVRRAAEHVCVRAAPDVGTSISGVDSSSRCPPPRAAAFVAWLDLAVPQGDRPVATTQPADRIKRG